MILKSGKYSFDILNKYGLKTTCETKNDIKIDRDSPSCSITKQDIKNNMESEKNEISKILSTWNDSENP